MRFVLPFAAVAAVVAFTPSARADVELGVAAGVTTYASTWRGDYGAGGSLRAGARFEHVFAVDFKVWESYATVNQRLNTGLSIGIAGYIPLRAVHPFARFFVMHQHEEGLVSAENAPAGTLFGIGSGIRHRAGGGLTLGAEIPFTSARDSRFVWSGLADVTAMYFPDDTLGPHSYIGLNLGVGFDYLLK